MLYSRLHQPVGSRMFQGSVYLTFFQHYAKYANWQHSIVPIAFSPSETNAKDKKCMILYVLETEEFRAFKRMLFHHQMETVFESILRLGRDGVEAPGPSEKQYRISPFLYSYCRLPEVPA
jgi:hypothetical protein